MTISVGDFTSPFLDPRSWDTLTVQGVPWYGSFSIKNARRKHKWDVKDAPGLEGPTETYRGKRPEIFRIEFQIWTDAQWLQWKAFSHLFEYRGAIGEVTPVSIQHPSLAAINISAVICEELGVLERKSDDGMWSVSVQLREYFPPPLVNTTATPPGAVNVPPNPAGLVPSAAVVAMEAKVASLQAAASALGSPGGLP